MALNSFGKQPRHLTGRAAPDYTDRAAEDRAGDAVDRALDIWIDHEPQMRIIAELRQYLRETAGRRGTPLNGRRLSQETQSGKSRTAERFKQLMSEAAVVAGLEPNPFEIVIITIDPRMTVKQFYEEILKNLGDEYHDVTDLKIGRRGDRPDRRNLKLLERRIGEYTERLGVKMILANEAQRLDRLTTDASDVTSRIMTFLDRGVVPLVLIGTEISVEFFERNMDLAARLGTPLDLKPLNIDASRNDAKLFKAFCQNYDQALVDCGALGVLSGFGQDEFLDGFYEVSSGHVGRVARLIQEALRPAVWRGACSIELFDLSNATRNYAIGNKWVSHDPFSKQVS